MDGYITVATGAQKYFHMAAQLALSIKFFDPVRPIALICDDASLIEPAYRHLFDQIIPIGSYAHLRGTESHLYLNKLSPYDRTIYIDSDCLVSNPRFSEVWSKLQSYSVTFPGEKIAKGFWRVDIQEQMKKIGSNYIVRLNGGVFYFDKSPKAQEFFEYAQHLFEDRKEEITVPHGTGTAKGGGYANEPIWGAAMAKLEMTIFPLTEQMNVSTLNLENSHIFEDLPAIVLVKSQRIQTPLITHFIGLGGSKAKKVNQLYADFLSVIIEKQKDNNAEMKPLFPPPESLLSD